MKKIIANINIILLIYLLSIGYSFAGIFDRNCDISLPSEQWDGCIGKAPFNINGIHANLTGMQGIYEGRWVNGRPDGEGIVEYSNTNIYEGKFEKGVFIYACSTLPTSWRWKDIIKTENSERKIKLKKTTEGVFNLRKISEVKIIKDQITLEIDSLTLMDELIATSFKNTTTRYYETKAVGGAFLTLFTLGIYPVLKPKEALSDFAGCTEPRSISYVPDQSNATKTGLRYVANDVIPRFEENLKISFKGFEKIFPITFTINQSRYVGAIDFSQLPELTNILTSRIHEPELLIDFECITCKTEVDIDRNKWDIAENFIGKSSVYAVGTSGINILLVNQRVAKEEAIEKENKARRDQEEMVRQERERIAREGDGSPDDLSCKQRKLKPSTPAYLKCRDQLIKNREIQAIKEEEIKNESLKKNFLNLNVENFSMEAAKIKCTDLGFKPATEGFGKCVLQLSK